MSNKSKKILAPAAMATLATVLAFGVWLSAGTAKSAPTSQTDTTSAPVVVENVQIHPDYPPTLTFDLTNKSDKDVVAVTVLMTPTNAAGPKTFHKVIGAGDLRLIDAGGSKSQKVNLPFKMPEKTLIDRSYNVSVDYVLFYDQSTWGPDAGGTSREISGMLKGVAFERTRLRTILQRKGTAALDAEVNRPIQ